jgi:hypothetical protein
MRLLRRKIVSLSMVSESAQHSKEFVLLSLEPWVVAKNSFMLELWCFLLLSRFLANGYSKGIRIVKYFCNSCRGIQQRLVGHDELMSQFYCSDNRFSVLYHV